MEVSTYGSSEVYRSQPDVLGRFARGPARTFSDAAPCEGLMQVSLCDIFCMLLGCEASCRQISFLHVLTVVLHRCHLPVLYIGLEYGLTSNAKLAERFFTLAQSIAPDDPFVLHEMGVIAFQNQE